MTLNELYERRSILRARRKDLERKLETLASEETKVRTAINAELQKDSRPIRGSGQPLKIMATTLEEVGVGANFLERRR